MTPPSHASQSAEAKLQQAAIDANADLTVLLQPSFYMALFNMLVLLATQRVPEEFMPARYLTMTYRGVRLRALLTLPFCFTSCGYLATSSLLCTAPSPLSGHLLGFVLSILYGASALWFRRVSWYYTALGVVYVSFGSLHHYRYLKMYGDDAPLFYWSDFVDLWRAACSTPQRPPQRGALAQAPDCAAVARLF